MKKKSFYYLFYRKGYIKFFRCMKLCFLFILLGIYSATAKTIAQDQVVSLNLKQVTYLELFNELHQKTGIRFLYSSDQLKNLARIDVRADQRKISEVLEEVLKGSGFTCVFEEDMVILKQEQRQQLAKLMISGCVKDTKKQPLPGVTVTIKGTSLGTMTDVDGNYSLNIPKMEKVILLFSFVGMKTVEMAYKGEKELNVVMEDEITEMDEVVVTGIFNKSRESYTGAVTTITSKEIKMFRGQNMLQTLRNIDPSFNIIQNNDFGSDPNRLPEVNIRGNSSLPGSLEELNAGAKAQLNTPLVIMDGFEISLQKLMDFNDEEIASINIMKDASATAIYGSRGANGVIVVTTRKPQAGKLKLFAKGGINLEMPDLSSYDLMNAREKLQFEKDLGFYDFTPGHEKLDELYNKTYRDILEGTDTYWLSQPLRTGIGKYWNIRLEGGSDEFRWSATVANRNTEGVMKNSGRNVFDGTINLSYTFKRLLFQNQTTVSTSKARESNYGTFSEYARMNPYWKPYDENGKPVKEFRGNELEGTGSTPNPLYNTQFNSKDERRETSIINNFSVEWQAVEGLLVRAQFGISKMFSSSDKYVPAKHTGFKDYKPEDYFRKGKYTYGTGENLAMDGSATVSYSRLFAGKHSLYAGLNWSASQQEGYGYTFVAEGFLDENFDFLSNAIAYEKNQRPGGTESISRRVGFTGNVNYTYDNRYYADFSYRVDGGSQFGSKNKFAPFWSAGIGWNIHREHFMQNQQLISNLRLKGSVGNTGSQQFDPYKSLTMYRYSLSDRYAFWNGAHLQGIGNENLKWQSTMQYNAGIEIGCWNNRLTASLDIYTKKTSNLLSELELPLSTGFPSYTENIGTTRNKGFEAMLSGYILRDTERQLLWSVTGKIAYNKNIIVKLSDAIKLQTEEATKQNVQLTNLLYEGRSVDAIYVVHSLGIDPGSGEELFLDKDGNPTFTWNANSRGCAGVSEPKYRGNLSSMFSWKDLTLNLSFGYHWGGQQYNSTIIERVEVNRSAVFYNVDKRVLTERWMKPGDVVPYKKISTLPTLWSSRFVQDDNMFALQNVSLSYRWHNRWVRQNLGMQSLTFGANMSDLFYISTIKRERGLSYPFARQLSFDLSLVF